jgi:2-oxoglutarate ferredoxin oxidoreductase subunit alpha
VANVADDIPLQELDGAETGDLLVLSWGGPYGACATAVHTAQKAGKKVTHCHLRYINPFPKNLETILRNFKQVLIPELNLGQLSMIIRSKFLIDAISLNKIQGKPFSVSEIVTKINSLVA